MAARLPIPGQDNGTWGAVLNEYLTVEHNADGTLKKAADITAAVSAASTAQTTANAAYVKPGLGIPETDLASAVQTKLNGAAVADGSITNNKLATNAVTTVKITDANITAAKLDSGVNASLTKANSAVQTVNTVAPVSGNVTLTAASVSAIPASEKGVASGVATLDGSSKVLAAQLPATGHLGEYPLLASGATVNAGQTVTYKGVPYAKTATATIVPASFAPSAWQRIERPNTSAIHRNSAFPTVMSSPPTLTVGGAAAATAITGSVLTAHNAAGAPYRYDGAPLRLPTASYYAAATLVRNATVGTGVQPLRIAFDVECTQFEIRTFANGAKFRIYVNEQLHASTMETLTTGNTDRLVLVNFGTRAYRRIVIEGENGFCFGGIRMIASDTLAPPMVPATAKLAVYGDSFVVGIGATNASDGYAQRIARILGFNDSRMLGVSGTGFVKDNGAEYRYQSRIQDLTDYQPDYLFIQGSQNDYGQAGVQAAVVAFIAAARAAVPQAKIIASTTMFATSYSAADATYMAQLAAYAETNVQFFDPRAWITGTGFVGGENGNGTADYYRLSDVTHPSQAGHDYLARRTASALAVEWGLTL